MPFHRVVSFLLNQHKGAYQRELDDLFKACWPESGRPPTAVALCKARRHLSPSVFDALNQQLIQQVGNSLPIIRFCGLRVFAVDSSVLNLPREAHIADFYGGQVQSGKRYPMARCSMLLDVSTRMTWHTTLLQYALGEVVGAAEHLTHVPEDSITLYDRGYPSFFMYALHQQHQRHVCMRIPRGFSAETDAVFASASANTNITLRANHEARLLCKEQDVSAAPITLRAVRVELPNEVEVLLTSLLDETQYPAEAFQALYHQRWTIETDFRELKSRLQIENWSGKSVMSVQQDIAAKALTKNLASYVIAQAQMRLDAQHDAQLEANDETHAGDVPRMRRQVNRTAALHCCKSVLLVYLLSPTPAGLEPIIQQVMRQTHVARPHRSFPRNKTRGKSNRYPYAYKQTA